MLGFLILQKYPCETIMEVIKRNLNKNIKTLVYFYSIHIFYVIIFVFWCVEVGVMEAISLKWIKTTMLLYNLKMSFFNYSINVIYIICLIIVE